MVLSFFCVRSFNFGWSPVYDCKAYYWDTCGSPVIKCRLFFSSATKWKNCAIVPSGHWALNTMTTNCDSMMCSHADHACYLDDDWRCRARTRPGHMTKHEIFVYKTLLSVHRRPKLTSRENANDEFMNASRVVWLGVKLREEPLKIWTRYKA